MEETAMPAVTEGFSGRFLWQEGLGRGGGAPRLDGEAGGGAERWC
jgi:hypothetical protein